MNLLNFISYSCIFVFVLYIISVNFFTKAKPNKSNARPPISPFTFFPKSKKESVSLKKAIELIHQSSNKK